MYRVFVDQFLAERVSKVGLADGSAQLSVKSEHLVGITGVKQMEIEASVLVTQR